MSLKELFILTKNNIKSLIIVLACFSVIGVSFSLSLSNVYTSMAVLQPNTLPDQNNSAAGGLNSLAKAVGFSSKSDNDRVLLGEAVIKSLAFSNLFRDNQSFVVDLIAAEDWSPSKGIIYDSGIYDSKKKAWKKKSILASDGKISPLNLHKELEERLSFSIDEDSGFVTISFKHYSPEFAKTTLDSIILNLNNFLKDYDYNEASNSIEFLLQTLNRQSAIEVRESISNLIASQLKVATLAQSSNSYLFRTIDPPFMPEKKSGPPRAIICILFFFTGAFGFISFLFIRETYILENS